jgi:hypothetical protein
MTSLVLQFNGAAVELLQGITRLRVNIKKRGGVEYLALRPSYRVSGKNLQARTAKAESGATLVEIPAGYLKELKYTRPDLGASFLFNDEGYGWFTLRELPDDATDATPTLIVADSALMKTAVKADAKEEPAEKPAKAEKAEKPAKAAKEKTEKAAKPAAKKATGGKSKGKKTEAATQPEAPAAPTTDTQAEPQTNVTETSETSAGDTTVQSSADELAKHFGLSAEEQAITAAGEANGEAQAAETAAEAANTPAAKAAAKSTTAAVKKASTKKQKDEGTQSA